MPEETAIPVASKSACCVEHLLLARSNSTLPPRCIKCNADCEARFNGRPLKVRAVTSNAGNLFTLGEGGRVVSAAEHFSSRRSGHVMAFLCPTHRRARWRFHLGLLGVSLLGVLWMVGVFLLAMPQPPAEPSNWTIALLLGGLLVAAFPIWTIATRGPLLKTEGIEGDVLVLSGAGEPFLASLPPLPVEDVTALQDKRA